MGHSSPEATEGAATAKAAPKGWHRFGFEAFGVPVAINLDSLALRGRVESVLPPGWRPADPGDADQFFTLKRRDGISFVVEHRDGAVSGSSDLDVALAVLETNLRTYVAAHAPDHVFVHAGVVGFQGRAIVIPSPSFGGKTTLVRELIRAGASYYSDEFAVLDAQGLVHPYAKPLSIRTDGVNQSDHHVGALGGTAGVDPLPVGLFVITRFVPGELWRPRRLSPGESILAILENTLPAQERPEQALRTIKQAVGSAVVLEGPRGEASQMIAQLLENVSA